MLQASRDHCIYTKKIWFFIYALFVLLVIDIILQLNNPHFGIFLNTGQIIYFCMLLIVLFLILPQSKLYYRKAVYQPGITLKTIEHLHFPVFIINTTGFQSFRFLNGLFRKTHGYQDKHDLTDWDILLLCLHTEQRHPFTTQINAVLNQETNDIDEFRFIDIYNKTYYYKIILEPVENTLPLQYAGTMINTTEKWELDKKFLSVKLELEKRIIDRTTDLVSINEEILAQNIFIKNIIEAITFPFFVVETNTYRVRLSNKASGMINQNGRKSCFESLHGLDNPCSTVNRKCPVDIVKKTKKNLTFETVEQSPDGSTKNIEISCYPIFDSLGEVKECVIYHQDVTERIKNINLLEESEEKFRSIFKSSPIGIALFDNTGSILDANPVAIQYLSVTTGEINIESRIQEIKIPKSIVNSMDVGTSKRFEIEIPLQNQKNAALPSEMNSMYFDVSINPIMLREMNSIRGYLVHFKDISDIKKTERALRLSHHEAEQANRLKSEFLANISHDLRTPLNAIINFSHALEKGTVGELNEEQTHLCGRIYASGQRLLKLINDLLDISKIESGNIELDIGKFYIPDLEKTIDDAAIAYKKVNVELETHIQEVFFYSDKLKVEQIIYNLVSNSFKYTNNGKVSVSLKMENDMLVITVQDTGVGIQSKDLNRIFDKYIQSTRISSIKSTGLGLAIVKELCELLGGNINVESEVGVGSTFVARLANLKN